MFLRQWVLVNGRQLFLGWMLLSLLINGGQVIARQNPYNQTTAVAFVPLVPGFDWYAWYETESGYIPDPAHFGAYVTLAADDTFYIGLGSARPAESDGALLAQFDGEQVTAIGPLTEQGIHEMIWANNTLHVAGTDPCCGDDWTAGNHYTYASPGPLVKHRDPIHGLPQVIHSWGLWSSREGVLYTAVTGGEGEQRWGQIFTSTTHGTSWQPAGQLGSYRMYDVMGFSRKLYALYNNAPGEPLRLAMSADSGLTWADVSAEPMHRIHMAGYGRGVVTVSFDRQALYTTVNNAVTRYDLPPGYKIGVSYADLPDYSNYNALVVVGRSLYAILEQGEPGNTVYWLAKTADLQQWEFIAQTTEPLISLAYWPAEQTFIVSSNGAQANLYRLDVQRP